MDARCVSGLRRWTHTVCLWAPTVDACCVSLARCLGSSSLGCWGQVGEPQGRDPGQDSNTVSVPHRVWRLKSLTSVCTAVRWVCENHQKGQGCREPWHLQLSIIMETFSFLRLPASPIQAQKGVLASKTWGSESSGKDWVGCVSSAVGRWACAAWGAGLWGPRPPLPPLCPVVPHCAGRRVCVAGLHSDGERMDSELVKYSYHHLSRGPRGNGTRIVGWTLCPETPPLIAQLPAEAPSGAGDAYAPCQ